MPYPTALELAEFLVDAGVINGFPVDYTPFENAIEAARGVWEKQTGWSIFLGETEDSTVTYRELCGDFLDFGGGYVSITSVTFDDEASPRAFDTDYLPKPDNKIPIRYLKLYSRPAKKIVIVGKRGYCSELSADVYQAILSYAGALVWTSVSATGGNVVSEVKQGDVTYKFQNSSDENPTNQHAQWSSLFKSTAAKYKRGLF